MNNLRCKTLCRSRISCDVVQMRDGRQAKLKRIMSTYVEIPQKVRQRCVVIVPVDTQGREDPGADAAAALVAGTTIVRVVGPLVLRHVLGCVHVVDA